ncbi:hypothetical protein F4824DRAFT_19595 [Ustulina deusta]|nr:hypothetical protein F4823DRAFT_38699 [Ustulina deusta]KAI3343752.1 hypothetical protein F4824DRAFT_19595 [Ustulina deusta]
MASNRPPNRGQGSPLRPNTPRDYIPTPIRTVAPTDALDHLLNEKQKSASVRVHPIARERFLTFSQLAPPTPTTPGSVKPSLISRRSALTATRRSLSSGLDLSKAAIKKTRPAVETAVAASKKAAVVAAGRLTRIATNALRASEKEKGKKKEKEDEKECEKECPLSRSSSSSSSTKSLFNRRRLPKLQIPEIGIAVENALNSACSTDTQDSPNFRLLELSPTSRDLKYEMLNDDHPQDVTAEFHNMLSARRRVRKGKFGAVVTRYCEARPGWNDHWGLRSYNDNREDREFLRRLTDALQEQKDYATRLVQRNPDLYTRLQPVSSPGCTLKMYWQHKSTFC